MSWRLGLPVYAQAHCSHVSGDGTARCAALMDVYGDHATTCNVGACVIQRHAVARRVCRDIGKASGFATFEEQAIPEFGLWPRKRRQPDGSMLSKAEEAKVDVVFPSIPLQTLLFLTSHGATVALGM